MAVTGWHLVGCDGSQYCARWRDFLPSGNVQLHSGLRCFLFAGGVSPLLSPPATASPPNRHMPLCRCHLTHRVIAAPCNAANRCDASLTYLPAAVIAHSYSCALCSHCPISYFRREIYFHTLKSYGTFHKPPPPNKKKQQQNKQTWCLVWFLSVFSRCCR